MQTQDSDALMCMMRGCTEHDVLPTTCNLCRRTYCAAHMKYESHNCAAVRDKQAAVCPLCQQVVPQRPGESADFAVSKHIDSGCQTVLSGAPDSEHARRTNFCSFPKCPVNEISLILCDYCRSSYCVAHRLPMDHHCARYAASRSPPPQEQLQKAAQKEHGAGGGGGASGKSPQKTAVASASAVLQFSNSRAHPLGRKLDDSVAKAVCPVFFHPLLQTRAAFFTFSCDEVIGRSLDTICKHANVTNRNNETVLDSERLLLYNLSSMIQLDPSSKVKECLRDGDPVLLMKGVEMDTDFMAAIHAKYGEGSSSSSGGKKKDDCTLS